jgi:hypothetical protein
MFLPVESRFWRGIPGLPDLTKANVVAMAALLGVLVFDARTLRSFAPSWIDLAMLLWCVSPFAASLTNGLGLYDGLSAVQARTAGWGVSYLLGRLYFRDLASLRDLAVAIAIGGLVYVPFCLWEMRMSPQLHRTLYGYHARPFITSMRYGGFRPSVFMHSSLMVGVWMASTAICAIWLHRARTVRVLAIVPTAWAAAVLFVVALACKVVGAATLMVGALGALFLGARARIAAPAILLASVVALYPLARLSGALSATSVHGVIMQVYDSNRAESMWVRLSNEDMLADKALQRPLFGWGRWGRSRVYDDEGKDISLTDGQWVLALGESGLVGLAALIAILTVPVIRALRLVPPRAWTHPAYAPVPALAVVAAIYGVDNLINAMLNPVIVLALGALANVDAAGVRSAAPAPEASRGGSRAGAAQ